MAGPLEDGGASQFAVLTKEQRSFFDEQGYLVVEDALPPDTVQQIDAAIDEVRARLGAEGGLQPNGGVNLRNCLVHHDAFFPLLDWPRTVPLAWQILNWNICLNTSHLIVVPSEEEPTEEEKNGLGWHRDAGTSSSEMEEPHPRLMLKIAYTISDQTDPASGATQVIPGSNRLLGRPSRDPRTGAMIGAKAMNLKPGSAFLFEQRTWHTVARNWSGRPRKTIFMGYGYRWMRPMDYFRMPEALISRCNPIQRQLICEASDPLSFYIPHAADVPLKFIVESE